MRIGIDASNLRRGGGITHIAELLSVADPARHAFERITVWGSEYTLGRLPKRPWLDLVSHSWLERTIVFRLLWKHMYLTAVARASCDLLFVPGGLFTGGFRPYVTMCQNMLPFEDAEMARYGVSYVYLRNRLLRSGQLRTFRNAAGLIFLSKYAREYVSQYFDVRGAVIKTIAHGVDAAFCVAPREQLGCDRFSGERRFKILYVSILDEYKHQWTVVEAVAKLIGRGVPLQLELVGPAYGPSLERTLATIDANQVARAHIYYRGEKTKLELIALYQSADMFLFASSCENLPNILIEAMSAGLPIASSNRGPMPEVLGDAGVYFDPELRDEIAIAIEKVFASRDLRASIAQRAYVEGQKYSWSKCADETFGFLNEIYAQNVCASSKC